MVEGKDTMSEHVAIVFLSPIAGVQQQQHSSLISIEEWYC